MTLDEIIAMASCAYGADDAVRRCWDAQLQRVNHQAANRVGDSLALFVCSEIAETYDPCASRRAQLAEAARVIQRAADELARIGQILRNPRQFDRDCAAEQLAA